MTGIERLYERIGFLFGSDDGSLPEFRLSGLTSGQMPAVYARLRQLGTEINEGAYFWDRREAREALLDSVPNAATLVVSGEADGFHFVLKDAWHQGTALPELGVFVDVCEIALDYRMGPEWGAREVAAFVAMLCELQRLAPESRVELEDAALPDVRARFAQAVAEYCSEFGGSRK